MSPEQATGDRGIDGRTDIYSLGAVTCEMLSGEPPLGKWIAYISEETGRPEVYVQPFPGPGGRHLISSGGGLEPVWSRDGTELFHRGGAALIAARLEPHPELRVVSRDTLFPMNGLAGDVEPAYDVFPDGKRFVFPRIVSRSTAPVVVMGWLDEVRERMAGARKD